MSTTTILLIAVPTLVVLAGVVLFAAARRRDTDQAVGHLSHETRSRDRGRIEPAADESAAVAAWPSRSARRPRSCPGSRRTPRPSACHAASS
jgi:hypothetical protein